MNGYTNWDTWEATNWCLNTEIIKNSILRATYNEAKTIITKHMTMVKYSYGSSIEIDKINFDEVIEAVRG